VTDRRARLVWLSRMRVLGLAVCLGLTSLTACTGVLKQLTSPGAAAREVARADGAAVRKSPNDSRSYRYVELPNRMRVLLVSDPKTDKSAASLVVFRGSFQDPEGYQGLAHFLEHMLFIGTAKYPEVDAYQEFVSKHGGSSNAYTASNHTNFYFDIQPEQFRDAMDRFSQFFISPLFEAKYVDREKNAVDSEYKLGLENDGWRGAAVMSQIVNPAHPEAKFNVGNLETLGDGVRDALLEFFEQNYSSDQMALVALSNEPLDALESWVAPMFGEVKNRELGPAPVQVPLFRESDLPAVVSYESVKEGYGVTYSFPVPAFRPYYRTQPATFLSNLLGHEGRGSLYQRLLREGWVESLAAGGQPIDDRTALLSVDIALTEAGYQHLDEITDALFDYIDLLRATPPERWRYDEQARIAELAFQFQEPSAADRFVVSVAPRFMDYPASEVLSGPYLMTEFDRALIESYVNLLTPENLLMEVTGRDVPTDQRERFYDVAYEVRRTLAPRGKLAADDLALPERNPYLPEDLTVLPNDPAPPRPAVETPELALWSDRDTEFDTPRSNLYLSLGVSGGIATPEDLAMATLYTSLVNDALSEDVYPAYLSGLGYSLNADGFGFELRVSGYSEKQLPFLESLLDALTSTEIDPARFAVLRDQLVREWRNSRDDPPYLQTFQAIGYLLLSNRWPPELLIPALEKRTPDDLKRWRDQRAARFHVLGLSHGNVSDDEPQALAEVLRKHLALGDFPRYEPEVVQVSSARRYAVDTDQQDAAMVLYLQDPDESTRSRALSALAASVLRQPYFTSLRTEQQLGYVVEVAPLAVRRRGGLAFIIQSPVASAAKLEGLTRSFLGDQLETIGSMSQDAFDGYQQGVVSRLTERDKNLGERGGRLWSNLELDVPSFDLDGEIAEQVKQLDLAQLVGFLKQTEARLQAERLMIYSKGKFDEVPTGGAQVGRLSDFKRGASGE